MRSRQRRHIGEKKIRVNRPWISIQHETKWVNTFSSIYFSPQFFFHRFLCFELLCRGAFDLLSYIHRHSSLPPISFVENDFLLVLWECLIRWGFLGVGFFVMGGGSSVANATHGTLKPTFDSGAIANDRSSRGNWCRANCPGKVLRVLIRGRSHIGVISAYEYLIITTQIRALSISSSTVSQAQPNIWIFLEMTLLQVSWKFPDSFDS